MEETGKKDRSTGEAILKPDVVNDYNINMRLVDKNDMQITGVDCMKVVSEMDKEGFFFPSISLYFLFFF